jgi:hypothetical protein
MGSINQTNDGSRYRVHDIVPNSLSTGDMYDVKLGAIVAQHSEIKEYFLLSDTDHWPVAGILNCAHLWVIRAKALGFSVYSVFCDKKKEIVEAQLSISAARLKSYCSNEFDALN